ncbi:DNA polymerase III subunit alpha [Candidatus Omnitrophus magneticus]|uniref:DNA polymerase III subunit alpha n=1 Tax=Candidatus Omnitrophus magneticus TaxID=1609969 RepID=A0A0F0CN28_9BACT|nr:DNA polymerase III subunit alpha [Candidatus Omnitrophus magneticus]
MNENNSGFVHLHVHTQFSLLDGACRIEELIKKTKEYGMTACAMTDHGNMFGTIEFYEEAVKAGVKPIIGAEVYVAPSSRFEKSVQAVKGAGFHLVLLAKNIEGYHNLIEIVSTGYLEGFYYKPRVDKEILTKFSKGLFALSACLKGEVAYYLMAGDNDRAKKAALEYNGIFGNGNFFLEIQDNHIPEQDVLNKKMVAFSRELNIPLVATNDVHYIDKLDARAHDALLCIQTQTTIESSDRMKFSTDQLYFKSPSEMKVSFKDTPEALENTVKIAEACNVSFKFNEIHLPVFKSPDTQDNTEFFRKLVMDGAKKRYGEITEPIEKRIKHEFDIIQKSGYVSYFLIVWDFINEARKLGIPVGPGRGSAAGSLISYAIGITNIDPLKYGLIFERFLNPARVTMPDIDIDFCFERRGEIIDYVVKKYSVDNVAQIITFGTMMAKGVLRDVGRVMGIPYAEVDKIAKMVPSDLGITLEEALAKEPELKSIYEKDPMVRSLIDVSRRLEGLNRHASTHAAGVVISDKPLKARIPLYKTPEGQVTTGYTMNALEKIGLLKMDFLGLKTLTVIDQAIKIIKKTRDFNLDIETIPLDDKKTYELLADGATSGVFQLESSGMKDLLRKINPERFEDLIAILALYRPGPLGSGMVDEFIKRKNGTSSFVYEHLALEPILKETYGVIVYQEQVMQIVSALAEFSMSEADNVRKIMAKKKPEALADLRIKFFEGTDKHNVDRKVAEKIIDQIEYFAGYGFNKSHSTGYALISYQTAYLKANYTVEFMAALLTSERNNMDKISDYISEAVRMGINVLPPDISESYKDFTVSGKDIRFGLVAIKNVGENAVLSIIDTREKGGKFKSLYDFAERLDSRTANKKLLESLIKCGAFDSTGIYRSRAFAAIDKILESAQSAQKDKQKGQLSFFDTAPNADEFKSVFQGIPEIPEWPDNELLLAEKEMLGFYISRHPLSNYEKLLNKYSTCKIAELSNLSDGQKVLIGGLINKVKITITKKNAQKMAIIRIEDLNGSLEVLVFPKLYAQVSSIIKEDALLYIDGRLDLKEEIPKILAEDIMPIDKVKEVYTKGVLIKLSTVGLEETLMMRLRILIQKYRGNIPVFIDFLAGDAKRKMRLALDNKLSVIPSDSLVDDLEKVVGEGNVKFLAKLA